MSSLLRKSASFASTGLQGRSFVTRIGPDIMGAARQAAIQYHANKKADETQIQNTADLFLQAALKKTLNETKFGEFTISKGSQIPEGLSAGMKSSVTQQILQYTRQTRPLTPGEEIPASEISRLQRLDDPTSLVHGSGGFFTFNVTDQKNTQYILGANTFRGLAFVFGGALDPSEKNYARAAKRELFEELYFNLCKLPEKELDNELQKWFHDAPNKDDIVKEAKIIINTLGEDNLFRKMGAEIYTLDKCPAGIILKTDPKEDLGENNQSYVRATFLANTIDTTQSELYTFVEKMSAVAKIFGPHMSKLASMLPMAKINQDYSGLPDVGEASEYLLFKKKDAANVDLHPLRVNGNELTPVIDLGDDKQGSLGFSVQMFSSAVQASIAKFLHGILGGDAKNPFDGPVKT